MDSVRYLRHILLSEIGLAGQELLLCARAHVGAGRGGGSLAHEVAIRYAERAGFASIGEGSIDTEHLAPVEVTRVFEAREVLAGSRATLQAMRQALGL